MIVFLLRVLITGALLVAPFILLAMASGKAQGLIWLMLPIVVAIPVLLIVLLIFVPAEYAAGAMGLSANVVVPLVGLAVGAGVVVVSALSNNSLQGALAKIGAGGASTIAALIGVIAGGAALGVAWRASAWAVTRFGWT